MTHHEHKGQGGEQTRQRKDPVCGMTVAGDTPHKIEHGGRTYLFCSAGCLEKFRKEPQRFAA